MHRIFHLINRDGGINSAPTDGLPLDIDFLDQPSNRVCDDLGQSLELGGEKKTQLHRDPSLEILDNTPPQRLQDAQSPWTYYPTEDPEDTVKTAEANGTVDDGSDANGRGPTCFNSPRFSGKIPLSWEVKPSSKNTDDIDTISIAATEPVSESESALNSPETCVKCTQESYHHENSLFSDMFANNTCGNATRPPLRRLKGFCFN